MKKVFLLSILFLITALSYGQHPHYKVSIDSMAIWETRKMTHPLSLDSNQAKRMLAATKNYFFDLQELNKTRPADSLRIVAIKGTQKNYISALKMILTKEQFDLYKIQQQATEKLFIENQNKRKIKVKSLDVDN